MSTGHEAKSKQGIAGWVRAVPVAVVVAVIGQTGLGH
jgi:hypothetical protein